MGRGLGENKPRRQRQVVKRYFPRACSREDCLSDHLIRPPQESSHKSFESQISPETPAKKLKILATNQGSWRRMYLSSPLAQRLFPSSFFSFGLENLDSPDSPVTVPPCYSFKSSRLDIFGLKQQLSLSSLLAILIPCFLPCLKWPAFSITRLRSRF